METILLVQLITIFGICYNIYQNKKERNERYEYQIRLEKKFKEVSDTSDKLARELLLCKKKHSIKIKK